MKKTAVAVACLMLMASFASGQVTQVLSRNAVGYVKVEAPANQLVLARVDFEPLDGAASWTVTNLIGDQLPAGSSILIWDRINAKYVGEGRTRSGWLPGTNVIRRGEAFFVRSGGTTNLYFMGEVPDQSSAPNTVVENVTGLGAFGYPYPVAESWTNMDLAKNGATGDALLLWDVDSQSYVGYGRTRSGWVGTEDVVLQPGQGFWYRSSVTQTWTVVKPYTWP